MALMKETQHHQEVQTNVGVKEWFIITGIGILISVVVDKLNKRGKKIMIEKLIKELKYAYENFYNVDYIEIVKESDLPEFWKGYICRFIEEEKKLQFGDKALLNSTVFFIENLNISIDNR